MCKPRVDGLSVAKAAGASSGRPEQYDESFLQFAYKVVPCNKTWRHDYATCPFAHPGESNERRHPSAYLPFMCCSTQHSTDLKEKCPFGTSCKYAHGHFELWLHPGRFRTKMCSLGTACKRPVCFFAHSAEELRVTPYSKLETSAVAAAAQLNSQADSCNHSISTGSSSKAWSARSGRSSSNGSDDLRCSADRLASPCGSPEYGANVHASSQLQQVQLEQQAPQINSLARLPVPNFVSSPTATAALLQSQRLQLQLSVDEGLLQAGLLPGRANAVLALQQQQQSMAQLVSVPHGSPIAQPQYQQQQVLFVTSPTMVSAAPEAVACTSGLSNWSSLAPLNAATGELSMPLATSRLLLQQQQLSSLGAPLSATDSLAASGQLLGLGAGSSMSSGFAAPSFNVGGLAGPLNQQHIRLQQQPPMRQQPAVLQQLLPPTPKQPFEQLFNLMALEVQGA
eukprot:GHRR01000587.1.p1 GENE.GHRR01000587.1~~GHRR01000587.1.p1  ORF type:complete len:453 (+),score=157.94 GHRR01000587.1:780-2138(+)